MPICFFAMVIHNILICPHFLSSRFLEFLNNYYYDLVEGIPLHLRRSMWFQLHGCSAHYRRGPQQWLDVNYPDQWIGCAGPVACQHTPMIPLNCFCIMFFF